MDGGDAYGMGMAAGQYKRGGKVRKPKAKRTEKKVRKANERKKQRR